MLVSLPANHVTMVPLIGRSHTAERTRSRAGGLCARIACGDCGRRRLHCPHRVCGVWLFASCATCSRLVGPDVGVEAVLVSCVVHDSEDSVCVDVRVGPPRRAAVGRFLPLRVRSCRLVRRFVRERIRLRRLVSWVEWLHWLQWNTGLEARIGDGEDCLRAAGSCTRTRTKNRRQKLTCDSCYGDEADEKNLKKHLKSR